MCIAIDITNYQAIGYLEDLGLLMPSERQIELMESIIKNECVPKRFQFKSCLTKRERECLYWAALGKSSAEIAAELEIKVTTIDWHK
jgi:DNA-binding CsgD family transcriptional regulator